MCPHRAGGASELGTRLPQETEALVDPPSTAGVRRPLSVQGCDRHRDYLSRCKNGKVTYLPLVDARASAACGGEWGGLAQEDACAPSVAPALPMGLLTP